MNKKHDPVTIHPNGDIQINGRWLTEGSEVSIYKNRGIYRFINSVETSDGKIVLNFIGGPLNHTMMRSFYPHQVKTIHNKKKRA